MVKSGKNLGPIRGFHCVGFPFVGVAVHYIITDKSSTESISVAPTTDLNGKTHTSPPKTIDYSSMPVDVLRRLEKARDTAIALLLRKLDEAEKKKNSK